MSRGLKWFLVIVTVTIITVVTLLFLVRSHDGPMGILSGGPFKKGELVTGVADWSFMDEFMTIELQTMRPARSRTMWLVVFENRMFVVSSYMNTHIGRAWKHWPRQLEKDNRTIVRADGNLYELQLNRITEGDVILPVLEKFNSKYKTPFTPEVIENGSSWLFELRTR